MNYFLDNEGSVYAYDDLQVKEGLVKLGLTPVSNDELLLIRLSEQNKSSSILRQLAIQDRLIKIDSESVRPMRAKIAGTASEYDTSLLAALDIEAQALRAELRDNSKDTGQ